MTRPQISKNLEPETGTNQSLIRLFQVTVEFLLRAWLEGVQRWFRAKVMDVAQERLSYSLWLFARKCVRVPLCKSLPPMFPQAADNSLAGAV